eukprot:TRINITY_DN10286_c0_g1_i1.p1 TRINITY_DN10286_c0_g1~~TRINITY_DN10286_c0_g1_i1.p1  ORF type:complete len:205 (+),score=69.94 TRINITY_DN10286_c0_g1_i1:74-688(+)
MGFDPQKLAKLQSQKTASRTGGKGSVRRKHKAVRKTVHQDDKRLKSVLQRLQCRDIPAIEEVNLIKQDEVIHFTTPKVQAAIAANTYVVSGTAETKKLQDILPSIIQQLGPDNLEFLKKMYSGKMPTLGDQEELPELVESFEDAAKKAAAAPSTTATTTTSSAPSTTTATAPTTPSTTAATTTTPTTASSSSATTSTATAAKKS